MVTKYVDMDLSIQDIQVYIAYLEQKSHIHKHVLKCFRMGCQNCIHYTIDSFGKFAHPQVIDDFVEKQYISWWKLDELKEVLKNGGFVRTEFFRAYFIPILQVTVEELSRLQADMKKQFMQRRISVNK